MISLPDLSDQHFEQIQIGKLALQSYGSVHSIAGEIYTVSCSDDNSVVKDILSREGNNKVLVIDARSHRIAMQVYQFGFARNVDRISLAERS
jgi:regulator of RNase E activity RraA